MSKVLIVVLLCIALIASSIAVWSIFFREPDVILAPDYAPAETEENAQTIPGDTGEKMESEAGGGSVSLTYSNQVSIDISDKKAALIFANPQKSNQDMLIQILIKGQVIAQSGKLAPGHQVTVLNLPEDSTDKLTVGGYDGKFQILYYDPVTGEKALVSTEIPIKIVVKE